MFPYHYIIIIYMFLIKDKPNRAPPKQGFQNLHLTGQGSTLEDCLIDSMSHPEGVQQERDLVDTVTIVH